MPSASPEVSDLELEFSTLGEVLTAFDLHERHVGLAKSRGEF